MTSPTFDFTIFHDIPETFPMSITNNDPIHHPLIPHHHVKHPIWYFHNADLFFSQCGILFGLHQQKFNISYFSRQLKHIEPCKTAAIGTLTSRPIYIDTIHFNIHNLYPITLPTIQFLNQHYWVESHKGFSHDSGICQYDTIGNAENTNDWFNMLFNSTTNPITNHRLHEILGRRNYRW